MHVINTRIRRGLIALGVLTLTASGLVLAAQSKRYAPYRVEARWALSLDNPLCTRFEAFRGLAKARAVTERTEEIMRASRFVGEDADGLFLYETPHGDVWMPQPNDLWSLAVVLAEQGQEVYGGAGGLGVRPGDVVIDGGAHVGLFTRTALAAGASKVVTFEVTPKSIMALRRNLAKEIGEGRVVVVDKGVWHEESTLPLVVVEGCSVCNSVTHPLPSTIDVPLTTIDQAVEELKLDRVDFISRHQRVQIRGIFGKTEGGLSMGLMWKPELPMWLEPGESVDFDIPKEITFLRDVEQIGIVDGRHDEHYAPSWAVKNAQAIFAAYTEFVNR